MSLEASSKTAPTPLRPERGGRSDTAASVLPGIGLCAVITAVAMAAQALEERVAGHPYIEALVLAILIGAAAWPSRWSMATHDCCR